MKIIQDLNVGWINAMKSFILFSLQFLAHQSYSFSMASHIFSQPDWYRRWLLHGECYNYPSDEDCIRNEGACIRSLEFNIDRFCTGFLCMSWYGCRLIEQKIPPIFIFCGVFTFITCLISAFNKHYREFLAE